MARGSIACAAAAFRIDPVTPDATPGQRGGATTLRRALAAPLGAEAIARLAEGIEVEAVQETGSTNDDLAQRARRAQPARPLLRAALEQRAGRGRLGRRWHASRGAALLFSLALPLASRDARTAAATLVCGVAVAEALRAAGAPVLLKWPNDLLLDGRKLGGILCEFVVDAQGSATLVVGVGVNLVVDASMRDSIGQPVAALAEAVGAAGLAHREPLIARIATGIVEALREFEAGGFVPFQPRFMRLFAHRDQQVDLRERDLRVATGRALGVDGEGRLLLATDEGLRAFSSGELSLRQSR